MDRKKDLADFEFYEWLYKTTICMLSAGDSVCVGELYILSIIESLNLGAFITVFICTIILSVLIVYFSKKLHSTLRGKYGNSTDNADNC